VLNTATPSMVLNAIAMFFSFGFVASANYIFNDLLDLAADRQHHRKRMRPIAAGVLTIKHAVMLAGTMLLIGVAIAVALPWMAMVVLGGYFVLTNLYSLWLKRRMLIDVFALAALYTVRIFAGAAATGVPPSFWLMAFSIFIFLSLALAKRYVEVRELVASGKKQITGRAYLATDDAFVLAAGLASGQLSILTLSLYLHEPETRDFYTRPELMWLMAPLMLYWLMRLWVKAHRGEMHDDPVVFAAMDGMSRLIILVCVGLIIGAL
jgi:4-hydroxybenzoate polyprenyltransferase